MMAARFLILVCVLDQALVTPVFAVAKHARTKTVVAEVTVPAVRAVRSGPIWRQDLFDRTNPNNLRTDLPAPPAQPGQF